MEYEESNLSKIFPTRFIHDRFKVLEWKWFNSRSTVGTVLVWDLSKERFIGFIGSPKYEASENDQVKEIVDYGCTVPTDMLIMIFKRYFSQDEVFKNLEKSLRLFMAFTELLDE